MQIEVSCVCVWNTNTVDAYVAKGYLVFIVEHKLLSTLPSVRILHLQTFRGACGACLLYMYSRITRQPGRSFIPRGTDTRRGGHPMPWVHFSDESINGIKYT
jgi:hypothetical protein